MYDLECVTDYVVLFPERPKRCEYRVIDPLHQYDLFEWVKLLAVFLVYNQNPLFLLLFLQKLLIFEGFLPLIMLLEVTQKEWIQTDSILNSIFVHGLSFRILLQEDGETRVTIETLRGKILEIVLISRGTTC